MNAFYITPEPGAEDARLHILVVEDNVMLRYTLAEWLRSFNYAVHEAATADEAMIILGSMLPVDMVITDVHMPGAIDGLALARHIMEDHRKVGLIVVSGDTPNDVIKDANLPTFFRKPYKLSDISEVIHAFDTNRERNN